MKENRAPKTLNEALQQQVKFENYNRWREIRNKMQKLYFSQVYIPSCSVMCTNNTGQHRSHGGMISRHFGWKKFSGTLNEGLIVVKGGRIFSHKGCLTSKYLHSGSDWVDVWKGYPQCTGRWWWCGRPQFIFAPRPTSWLIQLWRDQTRLTDNIQRDIIRSLHDVNH